MLFIRAHDLCLNVLASLRLSVQIQICLTRVFCQKKIKTTLVELFVMQSNAESLISEVPSSEDDVNTSVGPESIGTKQTYKPHNADLFLCGSVFHTSKSQRDRRVNNQVTGTNFYKTIQFSDEIRQVSCGQQHYMILTESGKLFCSGK